jgi:hypothetical protein
MSPHYATCVQIVYISAGGGWKEDGAVISEINMAQDYDRMVNRDYTGACGMQVAGVGQQRVTSTPRPPPPHCAN